MIKYFIKDMNYWCKMFQDDLKLQYCSVPYDFFQPSLQKYQEKNHPTFIQKKNRERLEADGVLGKDKDEPSSKKSKRAGSVEPLDKPESPLPLLPEDLQLKQVQNLHSFYAFWCQYFMWNISIWAVSRKKGPKRIFLSKCLFFCFVNVHYFQISLWNF